MKNDPKRKNTKKANSRKWKAQWKKIVSTLAAVTVFCTTYALILPAITVNSNTYCGLEEHEHTEACYTKELICGLTEGEIPGAEGGQEDAEAPQTETQTVTETVTETVIELQQVLVDEGHVHQDSCYEETRNLVCGLEETESKEAVLDEEGNVIEEAVEGHTHTDECYQVERVLVCGQEEREPVYEEQEVEVEKEVQKEVEVPVEQPAQPAQPAGEPHVHTDACYKEVLTCGKEEHKHVDECFSNPTLDLETAADWEKTLPKEDELTENWAEDVLTIAKSQLGYKESSRNFKAVNGDRKGYTRYGARFGAPYSDWCAMFIQFAMHYAGVDERLMPGNPSVSKWIENVKKIENYFEPADYTPVPGDIMFIDWDKVVEGVERDGDHIGIVAEVKTTEETTPDGAKLEVPTSIVTIEGNLDNEVKYNTYKIDDERILGYSHMPEKPETEEELEERVEEIEALIEGKELVEGEEGAGGEEPAEGTEEENEEIVVDTIIALASYTESGVQVNFEAPSSVFPEGTVDPALNVVEILPGTPEYDEYFAQAQANAGTEVLNARFFDISVVDLEGNEIKLNDESLAKVEIIFPENETMTTEGNIDVLHFAEEGLEVLESQVQGREEVEAITFDTTSFSPYGVVQTPKSGEGSTDGSSKPALAEKREKSDGTGGCEYVVTSWEALEKLIESGTYKDTDGSEKTDTTLTSIDVVIDGVIGANSTIDTKGKAIELNGQNGASVYVCSTATSLSGGMFKVDGGSMEIKNVKFSGQKATYTAGSGNTNCKKDISKSKVTKESDGSLKIDGIKFAKDSASTKNIIADNGAGDNQFFVDSESNGYFRIKEKFYYLGVSNNAAYLTDGEDPTEKGYYWSLRSDGVLVNKSNPNLIIWKDPKSDSNAVYVVEETTSQGCDSASNASADSWTAPAANSNDNINNLVNASTQGFFITAQGGANVTIGENTSFQDMIYNATTAGVAPTPIYVTGEDTTLVINSNTAVIKNNRSYIPALKESGRYILYKEVIARASSDMTWDLNPGGNTYRRSHDDGTKAAGAIFITDNATVNLINGTIGGENTATVNEGNTGMAGAVYIDEGTLNQSGGSIKGNQGLKGAVVVDGSTSKYNFTHGSVTKNDSTIHGGGISALNEGVVIIGESGQTCSEGSVPVISYNRTLDQGGGIYVHSDNVKLNRARIEYNAAHFMGGGIYVYGGDSAQDDRNSVLILDDAYITDNEAGNNAFSGQPERFGFDNTSWGGGQTYGEGGGIWSCTYGSFIMDGREIHIWNNSAHAPGKDFYKHSKGSSSGIITEFIKGDHDGYMDTKQTNDQGDDTSFATNGSFTPTSGRVSLINNGNTAALDNEMNNMCDSVRITNNRAGYAGGGIGSNGIISYLPLNDKNIYQPELSFTKAFTNTNTAGKTATFNVKIKNLVNSSEAVVEYNGIQLSDGASVVNDPNGVDPVGYNVNGWTATIPLPQMQFSDGTSIYAGLFGSADTAEINANNTDSSYSIDDRIKVVIEEVELTEDGVTGNVINTYELELGQMVYTHTSTQLTNNQQDLRITYHKIKLETSLTNVKNNSQGKVKITKKDSVTEDVLNSDEFTFEYRKVAKSGSTYSVIEGEAGQWNTFNKNNGVHTSDLLDANSYYEIKESATQNGYTGLGDGRIYVYVDASGNTSIDSHTGINGNISETTTSTLTDANVQGQLIAFDVFNKRETGLEIVKVSDQTNANGNAIPVAGGTTFQIKNFNYGSSNNSMSTPVTITLTEGNSFRLTDVMAAFANTGMTETQILKSKFYIQEVETHENDRYEGLQHVIPFKIEKKNGVYKFIPFKKSDISNVAPDPGTDSPFYKAGTNRSVINSTVYVEWENDGENIKGVTIERSADNASIKYTVTNKMKPIEIKVAKLDENGDPLPGATFKLRTAHGIGNDPLTQTANNPDNGIYSFVNPATGNKANFLQPGKAYYLWETDAPTGYSPLDVGVFIEIDVHGTVSLVSDAETLTNNSSRYNLLNNTISPAAVVNAISNGTISLSDTVDDNGVVTINIKNYPTTSLKVKKEWDSSAEAYKPADGVRVDLYADGVNKGSTYQKVLNSSNNWSAEWTNLPKYKPNSDTSEGALAFLEINYTVKEVFDGTNFKVAYDYTPEVVTQKCDTTKTITGWRDIRVADINGKNFRIVSNDNAYYLNNGTLGYTSATDESKYNQMLWTTEYYKYNSHTGRYDLGFKQVVGGRTYKIAYSNQNAANLVTDGYYYNTLEYSTKDQTMRYAYYNTTYYIDGDLTATAYSNNAKTVKFQEPIYQNNTNCITTTTPAQWTITNSYDTVELDFEKKWVGDSNYANKPTSLTVDLLVNGNVYEGKEITVSAATGWKGSWKELPMYYDGELATYSARERLNDDHYTTTIARQTGTGESSAIIGWREVTYDQLTDSGNQPFRIIAQNQAYYLDANNQLKTTSKNSTAFYDRMLWQTTKYEAKSTYNNGHYTYTTPVVEMGFRSAFNPQYHINTNSSNGKLTASTQDATYTYVVVNNQLTYTWGGYEYAFSGYIDQHCSGFITFEVPIYDTTNTNDKIVMTNTYNEHKGIKLVKVDENGSSSNWSKEAEFKLYHMKGEIAPHTLTLEDGEYLKDLTGNLIPSSRYNYFFLVETTTPEQTGNDGSTVTYGKLGTAIPIKIGTDGVATLVSSADEMPEWFTNNYDSTTNLLAAAGSGDKARPEIKVDWDLIGTDKTVTYSTDDKRLVITAKNNPISNELELLKIDNSTEPKPLDGADFTIVDANNNYVQNATNIYWTTVDGGFKVSNLAPGTYTITEFNAPTNHVKSNATVTVVVDDYGKITVTPSDTNVVVDVTYNGPTRVSFKFINEISSYELPEAGGIGTTILYITGAILVIGAGVLLIVRKKMNK